MRISSPTFRNQSGQPLRQSYQRCGQKCFLHLLLCLSVHITFLVGIFGIRIDPPSENYRAQNGKTAFEMMSCKKTRGIC